MGVSRSGYYKWKNRDKSGRDINREAMIALVSEIHEAHPFMDTAGLLLFSD